MNDNEINELKNTAIHNKKNMRFKSFEIEKDGATYILVVRGCGNKTVKLECYIPYLQILKGKDDREIEKEIFKLINTVY